MKIIIYDHTLNLKGRGQIQIDNQSPIKFRSGDQISISHQVDITFWHFIKGFLRVKILEIKQKNG